MSNLRQAPGTTLHFTAITNISGPCVGKVTNIWKNKLLWPAVWSHQAEAEKDQRDGVQDF